MRWGGNPASCSGGRRTTILVVLCALMLAWLGCAAGGMLRADETPRSPPQRFHTRDLSFAIPFSFDAQSGEVVEVQLLVSVDRGTTWHPYARQSPAEKSFRFRAPRDGEYWFSSRTIDRLGQSRPAGQPEAQLIVLIDTNLPRIQLHATPGPHGEVTVAWELVDEQLVPESFQLSYLAGISGVAQPIAVPASVPGTSPGTFHGQVTFWPQGGGRLAQLSAEVKDAAGNRGVAGKRVYLSPAPRGPRPAAPLSGPPPYTPPVPGAAPAPGQLVSQGGTVPGAAATAASPAGSQAAAVPGGTATPGSTRNSGSTGDGANGAGWSTVSPFVAGSSTPAASGTLAGGNTGPANASGPGVMVGTSGAGGGVPTQPLGGDLPGGERPRMTNSKKFALEYDIESAGPGGVSEVELWVTRDRGLAWSKMATDTDKQSPFDVTVDDEGIYGFRIVVVSKSGLVSTAPRSGDLADLWVGVDCTPPKVQLSSISFAEGDEAGKLDIRWEADDMRLSPRPVTLSYAESANGPWTAFATGLPNNGQYHWLVSGQVPKRVLFRIEVRDDAGNVGSYQLAEPISLQGLNPAGRIRGFTPAAPSASGASRQPLFGTRRR